MSETQDTRPGRHPLAIAWDKWIESPEGQQCLEPSILGFDERLCIYLQNRLHRAFMAGADVRTPEQAGESRG